MLILTSDIFRLYDQHSSLSVQCMHTVTGIMNYNTAQPTTHTRQLQRKCIWN